MIYGGHNNSPFSHRISLIGYPATGHFIFIFSPATAVILFIGLTYGSPAAIDAYDDLTDVNRFKFIESY